MRIVMFLPVAAAFLALAGCQFDLLYQAPPPPMMATGAPCGWRAVDAGICPRVGYRVPVGASY
jgi:hypothetical protein